MRPILFWCGDTTLIQPNDTISNKDESVQLQPNVKSIINQGVIRIKITEIKINWTILMGSYILLLKQFEQNLYSWDQEFGINLYIKIEPGSDSERHSTKYMVTPLQHRSIPTEHILLLYEYVHLNCTSIYLLECHRLNLIY